MLKGIQVLCRRTRQFFLIVIVNCILLVFRVSYTLYVVLNYVIVFYFMLQKYDFKILNVK